MITLVVPTRNRAHTLRLVAPSYFAQEGVDELIFVDDHGEDDTPTLIAALAERFKDKATHFIRNDRRLGASQSRNIGVAVAKNELILFCDDDEYLEPGYAKCCLEKLERLGAAAISGRRIYLLEAESCDQALRRFGTGLWRTKPFRPLLCEYVNGAKFTGDISLPLTNAVILTRKHLLMHFPFDGFYSRGNGYREESDYQMNLFTHGHMIYVTNACHSFHLPPAQCRVGGQRAPTWSRIGWSIYYTNYFYKKYLRDYSARMGFFMPRFAAVALFALFTLYREFVRAPLHRLVLQRMRARNDSGVALSPTLTPEAVGPRTELQAKEPRTEFQRQMRAGF